MYEISNIKIKKFFTKFALSNPIKSERNYLTGFTFIEVLIVIVIMSVLVALISALSYNTYKKQILDSNFSRIVSTLKAARMKSIQQDSNSSWGVHFDNSTTSPFYAEFKGTPYSVNSITQKTILPSNLRFTSPASSTAFDIYFQTTSGVVTGSTTISISFKGDSANYKSVTVSEVDGIKY